MAGYADDLSRVIADWALDDHVAHNIMLPAFFVGFAAWVLLPAMALLIGGLPVHYFSGRKVST